MTFDVGRCTAAADRIVAVEDLRDRRRPLTARSSRLSTRRIVGAVVEVILSLRTAAVGGVGK